MKSLNAVVCSGLKESPGFMQDVQALRQACVDYGAHTLVVIGAEMSPLILDLLSSFLRKDIRVYLVMKSLTDELHHAVERRGIEAHHELAWGKYRFIENVNVNQMEQFFVASISGAGMHSSSYCVRTGSESFTSAAMGAAVGAALSALPHLPGVPHQIGVVLPVFLKGQGHVILPNIHNTTKVRSIFHDRLSRYEVFASGHHRVLPLGRVNDLRKHQIFGQLPFSQVRGRAHHKSLNH